MESSRFRNVRKVQVLGPGWKGHLREDKDWALSALARDWASSPGLAQRPELDPSMAFPYMKARS